MFKLVFSAVFCAALCLPGTLFAQDCGCCKPAPRKRLKVEQVDLQVPSFKRECTTNACGCSSSKLVRTCKTIQLPKLTMVDAPADPCGGSGLFSRLRGRLGGGGLAGGGCCNAAPAPAPCGCQAAAAPAPEAASCGCSGDTSSAISYDETPMSYDSVASPMSFESSSISAAATTVDEAVPAP